MILDSCWCKVYLGKYGFSPRVRLARSRHEDINMTATATITITAATANAAERRYLNHWIRLNSDQPNAAEIAALALEGKRFKWNPFHAPEMRRAMPLVMPTAYEEAAAEMTAGQLKTARRIACAYGHLWAWSEMNAYEWADHHNEGREDGYNSSHHPLPKAEDYTASGRYSWKVFRDGRLVFQINRPEGVACRITGTLEDFRIEIFKCAYDRHLQCLFQALGSVFGIFDDAERIERIESAKGFRLTGIRHGELHKYIG